MFGKESEKDIKIQKKGYKLVCMGTGGWHVGDDVAKSE